MLKTRLRVVVLAYDGLCLFEFGIATEVFGLARPEFDDWYDFEITAVEPGPIRGMGGLAIEAPLALDRLAGASLIVIPGWRGLDAPVPDALIHALRQAHAGGARIATICSGAFVLAATGLLDGRTATTHWRYADHLAERFPGVSVDRDTLYSIDGALMTSAGSAAGLDLCLEIVRRDFGAAAANQVARRLVLPAHRDGGQAQFVARPVPRTRPDQLAALLDKLREKLDADWTLSAMARAARTSERTLVRRFREATGQSPLTWLTGERVERAKELLETTDSGLGDIALACGFAAPETFRLHFRRRTGISPGAFRKMYRA